MRSVSNGSASAAAPENRRVRSARSAARIGRLQALPDNAERELSLELHAARLEHPQTGRGGGLARESQQRGLADPWLALDHERRPSPRPRPLHGRVEPRALAGTVRSNPPIPAPMFPGRNRRVEVRVAPVALSPRCEEDRGSPNRRQEIR